MLILPRLTMAEKKTRHGKSSDIKFCKWQKSTWSARGVNAWVKNSKKH